MRRFAEAALDLGDLLRREAGRVGILSDHAQEQRGGFILTIGREPAHLRDRLFESLDHGGTLARHRIAGEGGEVA